MTCRDIHDAAGNVIGVACTRGVRAATCVECKHAASSLLCDWKLRGKLAGRTCDRKLCTACAQSPAAGKHLCPAHWRAWRSWAGKP
jgi:hypothetical protein